MAGPFGSSAEPINFQRAMVFVDGTNLFHRLQAAKLQLVSLWDMCRSYSQGRQIIRIYLYTTEPHYRRAKEQHGEGIFTNIRVTFGDAVPTGNGNVKEKGVDALLVADLVYHAAMKNIDYAMLVSADTDFAYALKRVEDFGCRTALVSVCAPPPPRLRESADDTFEVTEDAIVGGRWARRQP